MFMIGQDDWKKGRDRVKGEGFRLYCQTTQDVDRLAEGIKARGGTWSRSRATRNGAARLHGGRSRRLPEITISLGAEPGPKELKRRSARCWPSALVPRLSLAMEEPDPHAWLEDVEGARALAWAKEQNARTLPELEARPEYKPIYEKTLAILDSKDKIPTPALSARPSTTSGRTSSTSAASGGARRLDVLPHRRPRLGDGDRHRRAGQGREHAVGLQGRRLPAPGLPALPGLAVPRRRRRHRRARVRHRDEGVRRRRLHAAGGEVVGRAGGTRTRSGSAPTSAPAR